MHMVTTFTHSPPANIAIKILEQKIIEEKVMEEKVMEEKKTKNQNNNRKKPRLKLLRRDIS